jgi:transposase-like protein
MEQRLNLEPALSEGARRATEDRAGGAVRRPKRFSANHKVEIVLRLLRGEDLEFLSRELGIPASRICGWRDKFLEAGKTAVKRRDKGLRDEQIKRLQSKIGEITMDNELLQEKIKSLEAARPLRLRRSRR